MKIAEEGYFLCKSDEKTHLYARHDAFILVVVANRHTKEKKTTVKKQKIILYDNRVSQIFCNILVTCGTIRQLWMISPLPWSWGITLDCKMLSSHDTLRMVLARFAPLTKDESVLESMVFGLPNLTWTSTFLQLKRTFLNHLVTVLWSITPSPFAQQRFLVDFAALWVG